MLYHTEDETMKYTLIVCPHCHKVRIIQQRTEKTRCQFCGKVDRLRELKVFRSSDELQELMDWKAAFLAQVEGKSEEFVAGLLMEFREDENKAYQEKSSRVSSEKDTVLAVVDELERHKGEEGFTFGDFALLLRKKRSEMNAKKWIEVLQKEALVYKGKDGRYRVV